MNAPEDRPEIETLTARDEAYIAVADHVGDRDEANALLDAFRAEVLREAIAALSLVSTAALISSGKWWGGVEVATGLLEQLACQRRSQPAHPKPTPVGGTS